MDHDWFPQIIGSILAGKQHTCQACQGLQVSSHFKSILAQVRCCFEGVRVFASFPFLFRSTSPTSSFVCPPVSLVFSSSWLECLRQVLKSHPGQPMRASCSQKFPGNFEEVEWVRRFRVKVWRFAAPWGKLRVVQQKFREEGPGTRCVKLPGSCTSRFPLQVRSGGSASSKVVKGHRSLRPASTFATSSRQPLGSGIGLLHYSCRLSIRPWTTIYGQMWAKESKTLRHYTGKQLILQFAW